jgi:hypothetical protein
VSRSSRPARDAKQESSTTLGRVRYLGANMDGGQPMLKLRPSGLSSWLIVTGSFTCHEAPPRQGLFFVHPSTELGESTRPARSCRRGSESTLGSQGQDSTKLRFYAWTRVGKTVGKPALAAETQAIPMR